MKLHLPLFLRKSVLSCLALVAGCTLNSGTLAFADDLVLGAGDEFFIDYAENASIPDLENGTLQLSGGTLLELLNCGSGDGKTYTLVTGVSTLLDAEGNALTLGSANNAASLYFDITQPGTGFWGDATLELSTDGSLQLVRHNETVKNAITITERQTGDVDYLGYESVCFLNIVNSSGGAISPSFDCSLKHSICFRDNGRVIFSGNQTSSVGGAVYIIDGSLTMEGNASVEITGNASGFLGAVTGGGSAITFGNNGSVNFSGNSSGYYGGALVSSVGSVVILEGNCSVNFSGNASGYYGGAVFADSAVVLSSNGSVIFSKNTVSSEIEYTYGGAICGEYGSEITIANNGSVEFFGNTATTDSSSVDAYGGAICSFGDLIIQNNDSVEFYQNAAVVCETYRLNSLAVGGPGNTISLSAAEGKHITFRDSIIIDEENTFNLNADYTNANGETSKQQGDIIFTGATTVDDLYIVKGNVAGTAAEISSSRTSEVYTMTNLYGGRLRVEDGAIYQGYGITAHEGSAATVRVKDAELRHEGYDLTFNADTALELEGGNSISGNVQMLDDSTLRFIYAADTTLSLTGNLNFDGSVTIELVGYEEGCYKLVSQNGGTLSGWDMDALRFMNGQGESLDAARFAWVDKTLYYIGSVENLIWTNGAGDGLWNNISKNWASDGISYAQAHFLNIIFASDGHETITMVGSQAVNTLTVQQGGQYTLAGDTAETKLTVIGDVLLEENASLSIQGNLKSGALKGAGSLSVSGTLTLTDATASSSIGGDVSVSGALKAAGVLTVGGSLTAGSVSGEGNVITAGGDMEIGGSVSGDNNTLTAGSSLRVGAALSGSCNNLTVLNGDVSLEAEHMSINGSGNTISATGGNVNLMDDVVGSNNVITSTAVTYDSGQITGGSILSANKWASIVGDTNALTADADILLESIGSESAKGNNNVLTAGTSITINGTGNGTGINGSGNTLTAGTVITTKTIKGDWNKLTADEINATVVEGTGNEFVGGSVDVSGELKGASNTIEGNTVHVGTLSGMGHTIIGNDSVNINNLTVQAAAGDTGFSITALAGNVSIGTLNTTARNTISVGSSYGITVGSGSASNQTWTAGSLSVTGAAGLSLTDSTVTIGGTVQSEVLTLAGDTTLTAGLVSAGNISMTAGVSIVGDVNVSAGMDMAGGSISGTLTAGNATMMNAVTLGSANVANLQLQVGASLDVTGVLNAGTVTMQELASSAPALTVGQFAAGETVFRLSADMLNALNLEHGESVVIARADETINRDFTAALTSSGNTMLDVAAYRYVVSVSGTDVMVTLDYANFGSRVWYGNTWEGLEDWSDYVVCGYDAVDGVEMVNLEGVEYEGLYLLVAPGEASSTTVFSNGSLVIESAEIADGRVEIASDAKLEVYGILDASGKEISLRGTGSTLSLCDAQIGRLSGTGGTLTIEDEGVVSIGSDVTLGKLQNNGTLDIGKNKLNVAGAVTSAGSVIAGEVVVHNRANSVAKFDTLVADKVKVTNTLTSYADAISLGDGSAVGELYADNLTVREGTVQLGYADKATAQKLEKLELQKNATLHLNAQTELSVSNSLTAAANSAVQLEQDAALKYQEVSISNRNEDKTVSVNAAQLAAGSAELVLQDAYVTSTSGSSKALAYALVNSTVENAGSGSLQLTNASNELSGVVASGGNVEIYNAVSGMSLDELRVAAGLSLSAAVGDAGTTHTPAGNAEVAVSGSALLAGSSILNANLTLEAGSTLDMVSLDAGAVALNGTLTFGGKITLGDSLLALLDEKLGWESSITLFTGLERVDMSAVTGNSESGRVWAGDVFSNMADNQYYYLNFSADVGSLVMQIVPEPATATLSLLALAALAARRRRK